MNTAKGKKYKIHPEIIEEISKAIKSIRYGYVQIIIQDARVIQIEKTEKYRFNSGYKKGEEE